MLRRLEASVERYEAAQHSVANLFCAKIGSLKGSESGTSL